MFGMYDLSYYTAHVRLTRRPTPTTNAAYSVPPGSTWGMGSWITIYVLIWHATRNQQRDDAAYLNMILPFRGRAALCACILWRLAGGQ